jgi:hypothetical protein
VLIRTVRSNSPASLVLIPLIGAVLWLPAFLEPAAPAPIVYMPWYEAIDPFLRAHPLFSVIMGFVFCIGEAFLLDFVIHQHQVLTKKSWLPALIFTALSACTPGLHWLNPQLIAGLFILLAVHLLLGTYRVDRAFASVFNTGMLLGIASLFYAPSLLFVVFAIITIVLLRPFIWREWIILIFGLCIPWIYCGVYFFWTDQWTGLTAHYLTDPIVHRDFFFKLSKEYYPLTAVTALLLLVAVGRIIAGTGTATLKTKKGVTVMTWLLLFSVIALFPSQNNSVASYTFTLYPLSLFLSGYFLFARRVWIAETIFLLFILSIAASYFIGEIGWQL